MNSRKQQLIEMVTSAIQNFITPFVTQFRTLESSKNSQLVRQAYRNKLSTDDTETELDKQQKILDNLFVQHAFDAMDDIYRKIMAKSTPENELPSSLPSDELIKIENRMLEAFHAEYQQQTQQAVLHGGHHPNQPTSSSTAAIFKSAAISAQPTRTNQFETLQSILYAAFPQQLTCQFTKVNNEDRAKIMLNSNDPAIANAITQAFNKIGVTVSSPSTASFAMSLNGDGIEKIAELKQEITMLLKTAAVTAGENYFSLAIAAEKLAAQNKDPKQLVTAVENYQKAANLNNINAKANLGFFYLTGQGGLQRDANKAYQLMQQAAENGHKRAQANLARMLEKGDGVTRNLPEAKKWYQASGNAEKIKAIQTTMDSEATQQKTFALPKLK